MSKESFHSFLPSPDAEDERLAQTIRKYNRAYRCIKTIRSLIPLELFRPKNEHLLAPTLQRIHNELLRYEKDTH